jgi:hypothetical protein
MRIEEMDIREINMPSYMKGVHYPTKAVFEKGSVKSLFQNHEFLEEADVMEALKLACESRLNCIIAVPRGNYTAEALSMIKKYEPKIQLYRIGEGKSC